MRATFAAIGRRRRQPGGAAMPSLLPLSNVFLVLLPFLLVTTTAAPRGALAVAQRLEAAAGRPPAARLLVVLRPTSVHLELATGSAGRGTPVAVVARPGGSGGVAAALRQGLLQAQAAHPEATTAQLLPAAGTPYADVVAALGALDGWRRRPGHDLPAPRLQAVGLGAALREAS